MTAQKSGAIWANSSALMFIGAFLVLTLNSGCSLLSDAELSRINQILDLKEGATVADVGTGDGALLPKLAALVGEEGKVFGTEIDAQKLEELKEFVAGSDLPQIQVIQGTPIKTGLDPNCCDAIVSRMVYHHFTDPAPFIEDLHQALKPGGRLLIIDFQPSFWMSSSTPENLPADRGNQHGVTPELVMKEVSERGFTVKQRIDDWPGPGNLVLNHFAIEFKRE